MNIAYAFRRASWYPHFGRGTDLVPNTHRSAWLEKVKSMGFDGIEMGAGLTDGAEVNEANVKALGKEIEDAGLKVLGIRGGGTLTHPRLAKQNRKRWDGAIRFASWVGAPIVNSIMGTPSDPDRPGSFVGDSYSQGSSRQASADDYERAADGLRGFADQAAGLGVNISIETHQHSIFDTSWAALHTIELIDRPNVSINPDLGNIYWTWDNPEETCEDAIVSLAPVSNHYWHCKNLTKVHIEESRHAILLKVPLPDGDIDYRFALSAMIDGGFAGTVAVEGLRLGDSFSGDEKSCAYMRDLIAELT